MRLVFCPTIFLTVVVTLLAIGAAFLSSQSAADAQTSEAQLCESLEKLEQQCASLSRQACQAILETCQDYYEKQAAAFKSTITQKQQQEKTYQNQIAIFDGKIKQLANLISRNNLMIRDLRYQIQDTTDSIGKTEGEIQFTQQNLASLLQQIYEQDQRSAIEILLAGQTFTDFFENLAALELVQSRVRQLLAEIKALYVSLSQQKEKLEDEKESLERVNLLTGVQKQQQEQVKSEKQTLLQKTRGEKKMFEKYLEETEKIAAEIRKRIFELAQIAESEAPTLEQAYILAVETEKATGIRPALLLGLLTVESAIGKNVGQCNCRGRPNCSHPDIGYKQAMRAHQWSAFEGIVKELKLDLNSTPVSCSINGGAVQWGGAMGPAQFLPTTWLHYKPKVEGNLAAGEKPANPWRIKDAFLAAALYLKDWGASSQKEQDELKAATAYLCGTSTMTNRCRQAGGQGYRSQVIQKAVEYQDFVDRGILK